MQTLPEISPGSKDLFPEIPTQRVVGRKQRECCFARHHLSMAAVAYHEYALAVSRESGIFYRDDRRDAREFHTSKSGICRIAQEAEQKGFLELIEPRTRLSTGVFNSSKYRVLTHEKWAVTHPGECRGTCPTGGTGDADLSQNQHSPVPKSEVTCPTGGTKIREERLEGKEKRKSCAALSKNDSTPPAISFSEDDTEFYLATLSAAAEQVMMTSLPQMRMYNACLRRLFAQRDPILDTRTVYVIARAEAGLPNDYADSDMHAVIESEIMAAIDGGDPDDLWPAAEKVKDKLTFATVETVLAHHKTPRHNSS